MSLGSSLVYAVTRNVRYASMQVHGVSALVEYDPPDLPDRKHVVVERLPQGTRVSSNYSPEVSLHFSIPTPLIVDRVELTFQRVPHQDPNDFEVEHVFDGASVWVCRVAIAFVSNPGGSTFTMPKIGSIEVWDGGRRLFQHSDASSLVLIPAQLDAFRESPNPTSETVIEFELNKRVYSGLGVTLTIMLGAQLDHNEESSFLAHSAKAVFYM